MPRPGLIKRLFKAARDSQLNRREFLSMGVALGVAAIPASSKIIRPPFNFRRATNSVDPIVILGGGLAGLTTAFELAQMGYRSEIYEANNRLGGRVFTRTNFNQDGMYSELGGERIDSNHSDILDLCKILGVSIQDMTQEDPQILKNIYFADGKILTDESLTVLFEPLLEQIRKDTALAFPDGIPSISYASFTPAAQNFDRLSLEEYLQMHSSLASAEALDLLRSYYRSEYGLEPLQLSLLNLLLAEAESHSNRQPTSGTDESFRIIGGSHSLIKALQKSIIEMCTIHQSHKLIQIVELADSLRLSFESGKSVTEVDSKRVVCTIPFSVLRSIEGVSLLNLRPVALKCVQELGYGTNSKLNIGFTKRAWRHHRPASNGSVLTTRPSQVFWDLSRLQPGERGILTNFLGGYAGKELTPEHKTIALKDLDVIFAGLSSQFDGNVSFLNWHSNAFARGSYSALKPGQFTSIFGAVEAPELSGKLYFAGEHTSLEFGSYMNGSIQSARRVVKQLTGGLAHISKAFV